MESNLDKDIKKVSLEENNDNKEENKNISSNENNKEIDNKEKKSENIENLDDKNNNINKNNNFMIGPHMTINSLGNNYDSMNNIMMRMNMQRDYYQNHPMMQPMGGPNPMFSQYLSENEQKYYNFCKDLSFIHENQITVKVNQKFAEKFYNNYTVPPQFWKDIPSVQSKNEEIEYIDTRTFYPHPSYMMGGDSVTLMVFKATKKGKFKINFPNYTVDVNVIE